MAGGLMRTCCVAVPGDRDLLRGRAQGWGPAMWLCRGTGTRCMAVPADKDLPCGPCLGMGTCCVAVPGDKDLLRGRA